MIIRRLVYINHVKIKLNHPLTPNNSPPAKMTDNENSNTFECSVEGCGEHDMGTSGQPYGWCQCCEEFLICDKQDAEHSASMLYWEECHDHHTGGYSVCIKCALGAFKDLKETLGEEVVPGEEHCICPECKHDFGLLNELTSTNEKKFVCSIRPLGILNERYLSLQNG